MAPITENGTTGQVLPMASIVGGDATPSDATPFFTNSCTKFNNLLDKCSADDSDIVRPKPRVAHASDSDLKPKVIQASTSGGIKWNNSQTYHGDISSSQQTSHDEGYDNLPKPEAYLGDHQTISSPEVSPSPNEEVFKEKPAPLTESFLFPVSNSPIDIVTMLSRLALFTGELLNILTPKLRESSIIMTDKVTMLIGNRANRVTMPIE